MAKIKERRRLIEEGLWRPLQSEEVTPLSSESRPNPDAEEAQARSAGASGAAE